MELKPGYKQTEVGVIPEDWDVKRLRDISPSQSVGLVINPSSYFEANGEVPMLVGSCISENKINAEKASRISSKNSERLSACRLKAGDLVTVRVGFPGTTAVVPTELDGCNCASMMIIRRHKSFDSYWLAQLLNSPIGRVQIENVEYGTAQKQFNISHAIDFIFPVPPPAEQSKIAEAAKNFDEYIESLEQKIEKKRRIKQAAMQELLTGKRRLPGFEGEWECKMLGDIAVMNRISIVPAMYPNKLFIHFSLPAFDSGKTAQVEPGSSIGSNKFTVPASAILISKLNPRIPRAWAPQVVPPDAIASTEWLVLTPRDEIDRDYLFVLCSSPAFCEQMKLDATGTTGSHQRISPSAALKIPFMVAPQRDEQIAISSLFSGMDAELSVLEARLCKAREIKQGMMQQLLTGKIRLT
jgi:type I restriction enzyme, S subunit